MIATEDSYSREILAVKDRIKRLKDNYARYLRITEEKGQLDYEIKILDYDSKAYIFEIMTKTYLAFVLPRLLLLRHTLEVWSSHQACTVGEIRPSKATPQKMNLSLRALGMCKQRGKRRQPAPWHSSSSLPGC